LRELLSVGGISHFGRQATEKSSWVKGAVTEEILRWGADSRGDIYHIGFLVRHSKKMLSSPAIYRPAIRAPGRLSLRFSLGLRVFLHVLCLLLPGLPIQLLLLLVVFPRRSRVRCRTRVLRSSRHRPSSTQAHQQPANGPSIHAHSPFPFIFLPGLYPSLLSSNSSNPPLYSESVRYRAVASVSVVMLVIDSLPPHLQHNYDPVLSLAPTGQSAFVYSNGAYLLLLLSGR
jgi:hypothetical protein